MVDDSKLRATVQQGITAIRAGHSRQAIVYFRQAISVRPKSGELHLHLGTALELGGQDAEAMREYQFAIALNPLSSEPHLALAKLLLAHGHAAPAIQGFGKALAINPNSAEAYVWLAQALIAVDREAEAIENLERSIALDPNAAEPHAMLGYRLQTRGRFTEARASFERSIALQPRQAIAYHGIAQGAKLTRADEALVGQMKALLSDPDLHDRDRQYVLFSLGKAHGDLGEHEQAMQIYNEANRLAFKVCLGARPFQRERYAQVVQDTIERYTKACFEKSHGIASKSKAPIFIVGMMRSGTTLLDQILSSHCQVGAMGERDFWLRLGLKELSPKEAPRLQEQYLSLLRAASPSSPRVTDKTPQNFQALGLIHTAFPEAPIIHVRRNPLDNCLSIYTTPYDISPDFAHDASSIVFAYRTYERLMEHWRKVLPANRFLEIEYEDVVLNKEEVVRKVIEFCGLEWDEACLRHEHNDRVVKTPSLWQVRQPVYSSSIGRWRNYEPWLGELRTVCDDSATPA